MVEHGLYVGMCDLPNLKHTTVLKKDTYAYNCYSWGLEITSHWCDVSLGYFEDYDLVSFMKEYAKLGYRCTDKPKAEQVAIYGKNRNHVLHVARRMKINGKYTWTSKIGSLELITHKTLRELEGGMYGKVLHILSRPRKR